MNISDNEAPYLFFTVGSNTYAISSEFVMGIERLGALVTITKSELGVRGGTLYQNSFIHLIDLRRLFGLDSQIEEFEKSVQPEQRIRDHEKWITALEKSVQDRTEFLMTDDAHQCDFGKWYYSYKSENNMLMHQLRAIEAPHKSIHNTAKSIKKLMRDGHYEAAEAEIQELRATHYKTTLHILSSLRSIVIDNLKELYIVIDSDSCPKGIIVDSITSVEYISDTLPIPESMHGAKYIKCLGRRQSDGEIVIILNNSI